MNPGEQSQIQYNDVQEKSFRTPLNGNFEYPIVYERVVNGFPFQQNGVNVSVNGDGVVTRYSYNWNEAVTFEKKTPISKEAATQAFRNKALLSLTYQLPYEGAGEKKPILTYNMSSISLDAATGEPWDTGHKSPASDPKPLTDAPLGSKPAGNLNLTKDQAVEKVKSVFTLPAGVNLDDASYSENTNPETGEVQSVWNLRWSQPVEKDKADQIREGQNLWASVNSKTGEVTNFNSYRPYEQQAQVDGKVTIEAAEAKAIAFVKKQLPGYTNQLVLEPTDAKNIPADQLKNMRTWNLNFKRVIDGVFAGYESVNVGIDRTTGDVVNYSFYFSQLPYPEKKPEVISEDKAKDLLLSTHEIQLTYVLTDESSSILPIEKIRVMQAAGVAIPSSEGNVQSEAKLVYNLTPKYNREPFLLDAQNGQWRNATNGEVISLDKIKATDIEGHWAQNELQIMIDYQALDVTKDLVNPNQIITKGELIKMLVIAMNGGRGGIQYSKERAASFADVRNDSALFAYVENAVDRGLIERGKEFNPSAKMNREDVAELVVRALGLNNLTKYEAIFNDNFSDAANITRRGEAAIVVGLGIMSLNEGSFNPKEEVTRAQAATAFFRYLQKRADLQ
ncbi:hypothetical protein D3C73_615570 [compost metagenome]